MRLSDREFNAMNNAFRRLLQRTVEYPNFRNLGLSGKNGNILEIGCGSGYGAQLLSSLKPKSYLGVDLMPEQIELAQKRRLANTEFRLQDASDLSAILDQRKDCVVIFGALHHIPEWRKVVRECYRVLCPGGKLFVEEPDGGMLERWDRRFHWNHTPLGIFYLKDLENELQNCEFEILRRRYILGFGTYAAQKRINGA